jgi:hypothetical protein
MEAERVKKLSKKTLSKLKNKNKKLKPNQYKKLKRQSLRGNIKKASTDSNL